VEDEPPSTALKEASLLKYGKFHCSRDQAKPPRNTPKLLKNKKCRYNFKHEDIKKIVRNMPNIYNNFNNFLLGSFYGQ